ncbi:Purine catabolism regulatory protein [Microbacterium oxydans]|uniref:Purine catabolism regulatory protein-like family protein n=1 Tax=Microbacterium oxydans TaxID=82380 RepID=A0A0F0LAS0_9MICO|nr:PucR family transcriptional regulator [Microbacterium oxydans]KJL29395.1 Purine catabolism regulatory protein-like family protein [Microbacterium oxydans]CAH0164018.1 Purine catabolism regulatory protein [Microbacterium oxydans]
MVSLGELVRTAESALRPLAPFDAARTISGVHVSELGDPGRYLEGGELLLTTGIPLHGQSAAAYVDRLAEHGIGAIGIGLGEGWDDAPVELVERCAVAGIPVFAVPDGAPFLDVSRAFWSIAGRGGQEEALRTAHAHTRLVQAANDPDAVIAVIRVMAQAIGGWVAWLPWGQGAGPGMLYPPSLEGILPAVRGDVERSLLRSGVEAASFVSHGSTVLAHAVVVGERTRGALALGASRPLGRADRQLALTATALLRLLIATPTAAARPEGWIAELALRGDAAAARALASAADIELPLLFSVLVGSEDDVGFPFTVERGDLRLVLVPSGGTVHVDSGTLSAAVGLDDVAVAAARTLALHRASPGSGLRREPESRARRWVDDLMHADPVLLPTVVSYLRHRHQAERTARELGVHRNTVRPRILAAERLLGITLDDPDAAAELWIALRDQQR